MKKKNYTDTNTHTHTCIHIISEIENRHPMCIIETYTAILILFKISLRLVDTCHPFLRWSQKQYIKQSAQSVYLNDITRSQKLFSTQRKWIFFKPKTCTHRRRINSDLPSPSKTLFRVVAFRRRAQEGTRRGRGGITRACIRSCCFSVHRVSGVTATHTTLPMV